MKVDMNRRQFLKGTAWMGAVAGRRPNPSASSTSTSRRWASGPLGFAWWRFKEMDQKDFSSI